MLFWFFLFSPAMTSVAETNIQELGQVTGGLRLYLHDDGELGFRSGGVIWLEDGRSLHQENGKWLLLPSDPHQVETVNSLDFAVDGLTYIGRHVRITGGEFSGVDIEHGRLNLPGTWLLVDFRGMPRTDLKELLEYCRGFAAGNQRCIRTVTGTVTSTAGKVSLTYPELEHR
jgi:hypothetical protein